MSKRKMTKEQAEEAAVRVVRALDEAIANTKIDLTKLPVVKLSDLVPTPAQQIARLRTRLAKVERQSAHMVEQLRAWKIERHRTKSYARAACRLGKKVNEARELIERLTSWVEQFAGEDIPVVQEARKFLDADWSAILSASGEPAGRK